MGRGIFLYTATLFLSTFISCHPLLFYQYLHFFKVFHLFLPSLRHFLLKYSNSTNCSHLFLFLFLFAFMYNLQSFTLLLLSNTNSLVFDLLIFRLIFLIASYNLSNICCKLFEIATLHFCI